MVWFNWYRELIFFALDNSIKTRINSNKKGSVMKKHLKAAIRNLTSLVTECLRAEEAELMAEVQAALVKLLEIQERIEATQSSAKEGKACFRN
ncbi:MAG: hypothetical protein EOM06_13940 [Sphingobacteriia bacterium]|nr:hypothetical protein [Sphingobacteriia bacterium]